MQRIFAFFSFVAVVCWGVPLRGQCRTEGTDFWLSFLYFEPSSQATTTVYASARRACTVTITNPNTSFSQTLQVPAGGLRSLTVPSNTLFYNPSGIVQNVGYHVVSTDTITLFASVYGHLRYDMTLVLPTESLGSDYMVQSYDGQPGSTEKTPEFAVVAVDTGTTVVDVIPSDGTANGWTAGVVQTKTMHQGQVLYVAGALNTCLTGSRVHAREGKRVAVFSGHICAYVPSTAASCDCLFDQSFPVESWGEEFVVAGSNSVFPDHVQVMPMEDGCDIYVGGAYVATRNAGEVYSFVLPSVSRVAYVGTSSPASVCILMATVDGAGNGDPAMVSVPPVGQFVHGVTFAATQSSESMQHYVNIMTRTADTGRVTLDGGAVPGRSFQPVGGTPLYSVAQLPIVAGTHTVAASAGGGFCASVYGMGRRISYFTMTGSYLNQITKAYIEQQGLPVEEVGVCQGADNAVLQADARPWPDSVVWYVDGVRHGVADSFVVTTDSVRRFDLEAFFFFHDAAVRCLDSSQLLRRVAVEVYPTYGRHVYDTVSDVDLPWHFAGRRYMGPVEDDTIVFRSQEGCDSVVVYNLEVLEYAERDTVWDTICAGNAYEGHGFSVGEGEVAEDGTLVLERREGYRVTTLFLTVMGVPEVEVWVDTEATGCYRLMAMTDAECMLWSSDPLDSLLVGHEGERSVVVAPGVTTRYDVEVWNGGLRRCVSADGVSLRRVVSEFLWAPNVFTPGGEDNVFFRVEAVGVKETELFVYNRWGDCVFHSADCAEGWDGTYRGRPCEQGAYAYIVLYRTNDGTRRKKAGCVTLLR